MYSIATSFLNMLQGSFRALLGAEADRPLLHHLTLGSLATLLVFVALGLLANWIAAIAVRERANLQSVDAAGGAGSVAAAARPHLLRALGKPLYVLIWSVILYFIGSTLLQTLLAGDAVTSLQTALTVLLDVTLFVLFLWLSYRLTAVLERQLRVWAARSGSQLDDLLVPLIGRAIRILLPVVAVIFALPVIPAPPSLLQLVGRGTSIMLIVALALIAFQAVNTLETAVLLRFDIHAADNLRARKVYTQVQVLGKVLDVLIGLFALAAILMLFPQVRHIGTSLLASAGIVGIIAGVAAQKTLANLLAGFQIALAQPIRQDDVVIVEGEWGRVEEITLTYVVVHIWDDRRLVLPLSYFIEKPFQNWTRRSAELLGSVFVWTDYSFPVEKGREALKTIIESHPLWDGRFWNLQVADADQSAMQLRILATAADASRAWDLRCAIRERFIAFVQQHHPQSLPRRRAELSDAAR